MMKEQSLECKICNGTATRIYGGMKGYIEGTRFDIYECGNCDATFVDPLHVDQKIYEFIYNKADQVPGYERYYRYAQLVKKSNDPLLLLANAEGVYWSVRDALEKCFPDKGKASILEIGSGLGYLTYSLNKSGYKTVGLDISQEAVARANREYGEYYRSGDLFKLAESNTEKYDCILMLELIEHVEDPKAFITAALSLLKDGGKLILTTPNKTSAPKPVIWQSDFPPVHLWFLSEKTIKTLSVDLGKHCDFVDFTPFSKKFYAPSYDGSIEQIQLGLPRFTEKGEIFPGHEVSHVKSRFFGVWGRYILSYLRRRLKKKCISSRTTTMCVVLY